MDGGAVSVNLPPIGYSARPATPDDAEGVAAIMSELEALHERGTRTTAEGLALDWTGVDFDEETVVVEAPDGKLAGYADVLNQAFVNVIVYAYVHPSHVGRGVGRYLMEWGERWAWDHIDQAPENARVEVRQFVPLKDLAGQNLLQEHRYELVRSTWVMNIRLEEEPPEPEWPKGISLAPYRPGVDEREIFETIEAAFQDTWGRPPSTFERFLRHTEHREEFSDLWIVARSEPGAVAGVALGEVFDGEGWIISVGVLREHRRKGIGLALLHASFGAFYRREVREIGLSVDAASLTSAPRLYERAGMRPVSTYIVHQKILRPGIDLGDRTGE